MSKIKLIEQMQQILSQLIQHEVQPLLSEVPCENLLQVMIERFSSDEFSPSLLPLMEEFAELLSPHLNVKKLLRDQVPEHVTISWIIDKLEIQRSTFYKSVNNILLFPVLKAGRRPYYLKSDVIDLFDKTRGMGPHIFGKLASKTRKE